MPASGGAETKFAGTYGAYRPRWAPDGSGLAYIHARSIRWIDADGSNDHLLLGHAALPAHHANLTTIAWSPDGTQLLLPLYTIGYRLVRLYRVRARDQALSRGAQGSAEADWSTTDRIAAVKGNSVLTMDPDGSNRTEIYGYDVSWLRWSPDASMLVLPTRHQAFRRDLRDGSRRLEPDEPHELQGLRLVPQLVAGQHADRRGPGARRFRTAATCS